MPLLKGDWWARASAGNPPILKGEANIDTADLADASVATAKVADVNITSEKLSPNALRRSVVIALPDLAAGTTAPLTSQNAVFTPSLPIKIVSVSLTALTSWVQTTAQTTPVGTLYAGNNVVGTVNIPTTNAPARGTVLTFTGLGNLSVPGNTALTFGLPTATSAGMDAPGHLLQIDWDSSN